MIKNMKLSIKTLFISLTLFAVVFVSYIAYILSSNAMNKLFIQGSTKHFQQSVRFTQSILDNGLLKLESSFGAISFEDEFFRIKLADNTEVKIIKDYVARLVDEETK